jgi:hypothetical protein
LSREDERAGKTKEKTMTTNRYEQEKRDLVRFAAKIAAWKRDGDKWAAEGDREMAEVHEKDVGDLQAIYNAVRRGDYRDAARLARNLDTLVRDQIPNRLYNAINL